MRGDASNGSGCRRDTEVLRENQDKISGLLPDSQERLEVWSFCFLVNDGGVGLGETGFDQHGFQFCFAKTEPFIGIDLTRLFKAMLDQIEDDETAAGAKNAKGLLNSTLRMQGMME